MQTDREREREKKIKKEKKEKVIERERDKGYIYIEREREDGRKREGRMKEERNRDRKRERKSKSKRERERERKRKRQKDREREHQHTHTHTQRDGEDLPCRPPSSRKTRRCQHHQRIPPRSSVHSLGAILPGERSASACPDTVHSPVLPFLAFSGLLGTNLQVYQGFLSLPTPPASPENTLLGVGGA